MGHGKGIDYAADNVASLRVNRKRIVVPTTMVSKQ